MSHHLIPLGNGMSQGAPATGGLPFSVSFPAPVRRRLVLCKHYFGKKEKDGVSLTSALAREKIFLRRGHSSVGRAVALQAIGQGFESPCLHA